MGILKRIVASTFIVMVFVGCKKESPELVMLKSHPLDKHAYQKQTEFVQFVDYETDKWENYPNSYKVTVYFYKKNWDMLPDSNEVEAILLNRQELDVNATKFTYNDLGHGFYLMEFGLKFKDGSIYYQGNPKRISVPK